jgi:transcriptional regulator with XRE-family HTH domain
MRAQNESKKEFAFLLYMQGVTQKDILQRVGIGSTRTLSNWIKDGGWKEKRAAHTITRTTLINKTLVRINELLEMKDEQGRDVPIDADKLSKLAAIVEKLDKQSSPVTYIDVFTEFGKFLQIQAAHDASIDIDFMKKVNRYQDLMITRKLND